MSDLIVLALHHAGGSAATFRPLARSQARQDPVGRSFRLIPVELPGRGRRSREPLLTEVGEVLEDLAARCGPIVGEDFVVLGHSMGAYLGLLLLDLLGDRRCRGVVAMSNAAPSRARRLFETSPLTADDHDVLAVAERFGALSPQVLADTALRRRTLDLLRADFAVCDSIVERGFPTVDIDIQVMVGSEDVYPADDIAPWPTATRGVAAVHLVPGDHFFVERHPEAVCAVLSSLAQPHAASTCSGPAPATAPR